MVVFGMIVLMWIWECVFEMILMRLGIFVYFEVLYV